jgi:hypothetical protein
MAFRNFASWAVDITGGQLEARGDTSTLYILQKLHQNLGYYV